MRRWACLLVALVALALAGCGSSNYSASTTTVAAKPGADDRHLAAYVKSAAATSAAESSRFALKLDIKADGKTGYITGDGVGDRKHGSFTMRFDAPGLDGSVAFVFDGPTTYMKVTGLGGTLPEGKWIRLDTKDLETDAGKQALAQVNQTGADQALAYLKEVADVTAIGPENLDGVQTTHYRGRADRSKLAGADNSTADAIEKAGVSEVPIEAWIDAHNRLRRIEIDLVTDAAAIHETVDFSDYGVKVNPAVPAAAETVPFKQALKELFK